MSKRVLAALSVLVLAGMVLAAWQPVGGGKGNVKVAILEQNSSRTVFEVTVPGIEVTAVEAEGEEFSLLSLPGDVMATIEEGKPQVPKVSVLLAIPSGAQVSARAEVGETRKFSIPNVYPLQPALTEGQEPGPLVINRSYYSRDERFPGIDFSVTETGVWRELEVANIQVYPVQVNPARGEVTVASKVRVEVNYSGGAYPATVAEWMIPQYASYVDNFSETGIKPQTDYTEGVRYLVICHTNHATNTWLVDSLLGWVKQRGYDVRMITKSSFTAAEIKDSVYYEYGRHTPPVLRWALLVGEYSEIPMGSYTGVGKSDYYFSDFLPYPSGDKYPEVGLARLSPESPTDLENQIRKILKYEKDPATTNNWLTKLVMAAHSEQYPAKYSGCVRGVYNMPKPYYNPSCETIMGRYQGNTQVANAVNSGTGIMIYRGHGNIQEWSSWGTSGSWNNSNVSALTNGDMTSVLYHFACYCGDIANSVCHAEAWMRKYPGGSVSGLGATQASYTYPNHGQCSTVVRATCDTWTITVPGVRDYPGPVFDVSGVMAYMDAFLAKYWNTSPNYYNIYMYLTLGDPSMPIWSGGMPQEADVAVPESIPLGPYNMNVAVEVGGRPVEGALVCAWKDPDFYVVERTDATGNAMLAVNAGTPGEVLVTVSEGHAQHSTPGVQHTPILPHETTVPAGGGGVPQPNLRYVSNQVDDAAGNNNGRFDPGETADIIVTVRNTGNAEAQNVTAKLRSGNALFTVQDSTSNYGNIPADSIRNNNSDRFTAHAANSIPGGTMVPCTLLLHSENWAHDWTYTFVLQVGLPPIPGQFVVDIDTGSVRLSVCAIGSIGYDEPPADLGSGFQVPKSAASCLFFGGVMAGNSETYLVDHHFGDPPNGPTNQDWRMADSLRIVFPPTPADEQWWNTMTDAGHSSPRGLEATQRWYMNADGGYDDWALVMFRLRNGGSSAINGLYAGMIGDFDVGTSPTTNVAGSDTVRRGVWMRHSTNQNPTAGFVLLDPPQFANLTAIDHARYVYPESCMTDGQKYRILNGTIAERTSNRAYDWSIAASAGPFDLGVGEEQRVVFAVVGGTSESDWLANADSAQHWFNANLLGIVEDEGPITLADARRPFFLSPNPFARGTFLHYYSPAPGRLELAAFDAAGRQVDELSLDIGKGSGKYLWKPNLASGVYFLQLRTPDRESVLKVLVAE